VKKTPDIQRPALVGTHIIAHKVEELIPFDRNSRTHSEAQVAQIAASIMEYGFTNPVLIDEANTIIAGEGRVLAARKLKLEAVPCIILSGLTAAQKAAYVIADNKLALNSGWDTEKLLAELGNLVDLDFDINLTGFNEVEAIELSADLDLDIPDVIEDGAASPDEGMPAPSSTTSSQPNPGEQKDWSGMPEYNQPDAGPFRTMLVHFNDQAAVDAFAALVGQNITDKTKYVWYPKQEKTAAPGQVYE
jgi:hypothetical protein